jgi:hypothetical protein
VYHSDNLVHGLLFGNTSFTLQKELCQQLDTIRVGVSFFLITNSMTMMLGLSGGISKMCSPSKYDLVYDLDLASGCIMVQYLEILPVAEPLSPLQSPLSKIQ